MMSLNERMKIKRIKQDYREAHKHSFAEKLCGVSQREE
jgi:hypothetical protein